MKEYKPKLGLTLTGRRGGGGVRRVWEEVGELEKVGT
jgi:hypothetical protein